MPYCPKCDMEFVEGITVCSDCKGPLVESKEAAMAMKQQAQEEEQARKQAELEAMEDLSAVSDPRPAKKPRPRSQVYVKKSQKYSDLRSSADAFLLVGGVLTAVSVLLWTGFIPFPGNNFSSPIIKLVLTLMGLGSLYVSWRSFHSAGKVKVLAAEEEQATEKLIQWFLDSHTAGEMDGQLTDEAGELSPEELSLKRFELIQDILVTSHDLPDQSYVDMLAEEIYGKIFEE